MFAKTNLRGGRRRSIFELFQSFCGTLSPGSWSGLAFDHRTGDEAKRA
jgi:hypothetical protein